MILAVAVSVLLVACLPGTSVADCPELETTPWLLENYPNPVRDTEACGTGRQRICDPDNVLTEEERHYIKTAIDDTCSQTSCPCSSGCGADCAGYDVAVAVVGKLVLTSGSDALEETKRWATYLEQDGWHFGFCNNDLVIVLSHDDKRIYTSIGSATKSHLTDICIDRIFHHVKRYFPSCQYGVGIKAMIDLYRKTLQNGYCVLTASGSFSTGPDDADEGGGPNVGLIVALSLVGGLGGVFIITLIICCCCCGGSCAGRGGGGSSSGGGFWGGNHDSGWGWGGGGGGGGGGDSGGGGGGWD